MNITLDEQQTAVVECDDDHIAVQAFAGTGKSTTLNAYARARPNQRMLYLAFNASAAKQARQRFPKNVTCYTPHALAWRHMHAKYGHKMRHRPPAVFEVAQMLGASHLLASLCLRTLDRFFASADLDITPKHVMAIHRPDDVDPQTLLRLARKLWSAMHDPAHPCPISHDGYLKAFQISWPSIHGFDTILLDEAQDTTPAVLDILLSQSTKKVFVGDAHQAIYGWRGAVNVLDHLPRATRLSLDGSYRFGEQVATIARAILRVGKGVNTNLRGLGQDQLAPVVPGPHAAMVFRTNSALFDHAVRMTRGGGRVHFVGGVENYAFDGLIDAWHLLHKDLSSVKDPVLRSLGSFKALEEYAASTGDPEIRSRCRIAKMHHNLPHLVERITRQAAPTPNQASVTLGTAHRFKGLEAREVRIGEDFAPLVRIRDGVRTPVDPPQDAEEVNLAYVAVTRASHVLDVPRDMIDLMILDLQRQG
jgi:superfamily I DNA/RNA helicase